MITFLIGVAVGFVVGVLVGRKNKGTVETVVSTVKTDVSKATDGKVSI